MQVKKQQLELDMEKQTGSIGVGSCHGEGALGGVGLTGTQEVVTVAWHGRMGQK